MLNFSFEKEIEESEKKKSFFIRLMFHYLSLHIFDLFYDL